MSVRIAAKLPEDRDGLSESERRLRSERGPVVVVAVLYPRSVAEVLDRPEDPFAVVVGVEALEVLKGDDAKVAARDLLDVEYERRTGRLRLPLEEEG